MSQKIWCMAASALVVASAGCNVNLGVSTDPTPQITCADSTECPSPLVCDQITNICRAAEAGGESAPIVSVAVPDDSNGRPLREATFVVSLRDLNGDPNGTETVSLFVEYGLGEDPTEWFAAAATLADGSPLENIVATNDTTEITVRWDMLAATDLSFAAADLDGDLATAADTVVAYEDAVVLRVTATDSTQLQSEAATSPAFSIGNDSPAALIDSNVIVRIEGGDAPVSYSLEDSSSDVSRIELEFRPVGETVWTPASLVLGSVDNLLPIVGQVYVAVWDTEDTVGGIGLTNQRAEIRIRGVDEPQTGEEHFGDWSPVLTTDIIRNQTPPEILELEVPETFAGRGSGALLVVYRAFDEESDDVDVQVEYSLGSQIDWTPCAEYGSTSSSGVRDLATDNVDGVPHTFLWDTSALTFGFPTTPVFLRVSVSDGFDNNPVRRSVIELGTAIGPLGAQPFRLLNNPLPELPRAVAVNFYGMDGDAEPDLVLVGTSNVYFANGTVDGRFEALAAAGSAMDLGVPRRIFSADLNHDGDLDFAAEPSAGFGPVFFLNDGDDTFTESATLPGGVSINGPALATGQLDPGPLTDVAYADMGNLLVRLGTGSTPPFYDAVATSVRNMVDPTAIHIADVVATAAADIIFGTDAGKIVVLAGAGDGVTFADATELDAPGTIDAIRTRDINGDGDRDIVALSRTGRTVIVYTRTPIGFSDPQIIPVRPGPLDVQLRDFNGDSVQDIVVSFDTGASVSVYVGDALSGTPLGSFLDPADFSAPGTSVGLMAAGDLDGDSLADIVIPSDMPTGPEAAWLLRADNVSGIETAAWQIDASPLIQGSDRAFAADLDADGGPEIVAALKDANTIILLTEGALRGTLASFGDAAVDSSVQPYQPNFVAPGDFNGDGFVDIVHSSGGPQPLGGFPNVGLRVAFADVALSLPTGGFTVVRDDDTLNPDGVGIGDLDGDGLDDLVVIRSQTLRFQISDGAGGFMEVDTSPTDLDLNLAIGDGNRVRRLEIVDIDHDGDRDVIVPTSPPEVHLQASDGTFTDPSLLGFNGGTPASVMADFNADGEWDIALGGIAMTVLEGDGTGSFGGPDIFTLPSEVNSLAAVDVTGDGALDLVATRYQGGSLYYFTGTTDRGRPTGEFLNSVEVGGFVQTTDLDVFDPDRDGLPDFVVGDTEASTLGFAFTGNDAVRQSHSRPLQVVTSLSAASMPPLLFAPAEYVPSDLDRFGEFPQLTITAHVARLVPQSRVTDAWSALEQTSVDDPAISQDVRRPITAPWYVTGDKRVKRTAGDRLRVEELYGPQDTDGRTGLTLSPSGAEIASGFVIDLPIFGSESDPASQNVVVYRRTLTLRRSQEQPGDPLLGQLAGRFLLPQNPLGGRVWVESETWTEIPRAAGDDITVGSGARFAVLNGQQAVRVVTDELGLFVAYKIP